MSKIIWITKFTPCKDSFFCQAIYLNIKWNTLYLIRELYSKRFRLRETLNLSTKANWSKHVFFVCVFLGCFRGTPYTTNTKIKPFLAVCGKPTSWGPKKFWSKDILQMFACNVTFFSSFSFLMIFCVFQHFFGFWSHPTVDQPTMYSGGVSRGGSLAKQIKPSPDQIPFGKYIGKSIFLRSFLRKILQNWFTKQFLELILDFWKCSENA